MVYLTIVNKTYVTVTLGWHDSSLDFYILINNSILFDTVSSRDSGLMPHSAQCAAAILNVIMLYFLERHL